MEPLIWTLTVRSLLALLLATLGSASARWSGRPGMTYAVCALAIGVLLAPPLFEVAVLPAPAADAIPQVADSVAELPLLATRSALSTPDGALFGFSIAHWLFAFWGAGSLVILLLGLWRLRRFSNALGDRRPATCEMRAASDRIGREIGLRRVPQVALTDTAITPLLRQRGATLEILFPSGLLRRLTRDERDTLLTHELMHVRRRDHWMRLFEFAGTTVFWWHPAVWWARRQLRRAEEQLCDRRVIAHLPHLRAAYARGLFKTAEYLTAADRRLPALTSGAGEARFLKERLMMIVEHRKTRLLSNSQRFLLTLLGAGLLAFLPTWAERAPQEPLPAADASIQSGKRMLELERQVRELEMQLAELRAEQEALRDVAPRLTSEREILEGERLQFEVQRRRAAVALEAQARELALEAQRRQLEWQVERQAELELQSRESRQVAAEAGRLRSPEEQMELELHRQEEQLRELELTKAFERAAVAERLEDLRADAEIERLNRLVAELKARLAQSEADED